LAVLIPLRVLLDFRIAYSPPLEATSRDFQIYIESLCTMAMINDQKMQMQPQQKREEVIL
jgi:hypothetical protein